MNDDGLLPYEFKMGFLIGFVSGSGFMGILVLIVAGRK